MHHLATIINVRINLAYVLLLSRRAVAIKKPELAGVVLTQDLVFAGRPLANKESTVHWANNRPLD